jgi:hypothetical protein
MKPIPLPADDHPSFRLAARAGWRRPRAAALGARARGAGLALLVLICAAAAAHAQPAAAPAAATGASKPAAAAAARPAAASVGEHQHKDIARHRAIAAAHEQAARCLESGTAEAQCHERLREACKGLAIGRYCGMRHEH